MLGILRIQLMTSIYSIIKIIDLIYYLRSNSSRFLAASNFILVELLAIYCTLPSR
jgi:hypothetical protein